MDIIKENYVKFPILLYVLGFAVHNSYLSLFGSYEFELIQARYILSGIGFVGFFSVCVVYMSFNINPSYLPDNYRLKIFLPWLLRVFALPAILYMVLHGTPPTSIENHSIDEMALSIYLLLGFLIVITSLSNVIYMTENGEDWYSKMVRTLSCWGSVPFLGLCIYVSAYNTELRSLIMLMLFFVFGFVGMSMRHADRKHSIEPDYLNSEADEEAENSFQMVVGVLALCFLCWIAISKYSEDIYPYIPTALGGSKIESAILHTETTSYSVDVIQETGKWFLVRNSETSQIEKIRTSMVDKVVYIGN
ncbi:hypothetical protein [Vibrio pectenicida]|uniref:Uncharacterized protein n=1 Tax=Vibrio pectenicida TaxID=62763 RepID=A0A427U1D4_9VIBR|nr:hypothetical protein [Vibrio pectenicida]RSD30455.1 hypothetical protein EJA03_13740 [Vibrio pectenicida]